jgi:hypothetical protein
MPPKTIKMATGKKVTIKSWLLPNGNMLILQRMAHDRDLVELIEVEPGTSLFKRFSTVTVKVPDDEPDPRDDPRYLEKMRAVKSTREYQAWQQEQKP